MKSAPTFSPHFSRSHPRILQPEHFRPGRRHYHATAAQVASTSATILFHCLIRKLSIPSRFLHHGLSESDTTTCRWNILLALCSSSMISSSASATGNRSALLKKNQRGRGGRGINAPGVVPPYRVQGARSPTRLCT